MNTIAMIKNEETGKGKLTELEGEYTISDTIAIYDYQYLDDIAQHRQYLHTPTNTRVVHKQYSISAYNVLRSIQKLSFDCWEPVLPEIYILCFNHDLQIVETLEKYIEGQSLESFLKDPDCEATIFDILTFSKTITTLLSDLDVDDIILRDLAPQNIILEEIYLPYVIDFNSACFGCLESYSNDKPVGTIGYASPEHFEINKVTPKSDVYSFGKILSELIEKYDNSEWDHPLIMPIIKTVVSQMISNDPTKRPNANSLQELFSYLLDVDEEDEVDVEEFLDMLNYY